MLRRITALVLPLLLAALVVAPLVLLQPFGVQTARSMALAYALRRWGPAITVAAGALLVTMAWMAWREWRGRLARGLIVAGLALTAGAIWVARVNMFERMFNPLAHPRFAATSAASFVEPDDVVLAVAVGGDAAAYPVRQLAYHHVVNDTIGGVPAVVTY